jgi:hypothetical protein
MMSNKFNRGIGVMIWITKGPLTAFPNAYRAAGGGLD